MLMPKRTKYRKQHRGRMTGSAKGATELHFGDYGLVALEPCWLTNRQMEAARVAIVRYLRRGGKIWFRVFPDKPYTKRPAETRMGSGKGSVEGWVAVVKRGRIIMELAGVSEADSIEALRRASHKLPIRTKIVARRDFTAGAAAELELETDISGSIVSSGLSGAGKSLDPDTPDNPDTPDFLQKMPAATKEEDSDETAQSEPTARNDTEGVGTGTGEAQG